MTPRTSGSFSSDASVAAQRKAARRVVRVVAFAGDTAARSARCCAAHRPAAPTRPDSWSSRAPWAPRDGWVAARERWWRALSALVCGHRAASTGAAPAQRQRRQPSGTLLHNDERRGGCARGRSVSGVQCCRRGATRSRPRAPRAAAPRVRSRSRNYRTGHGARYAQSDGETERRRRASDCATSEAKARRREQPARAASTQPLGRARATARAGRARHGVVPAQVSPDCGTRACAPRSRSPWARARVPGRRQSGCTPRRWRRSASCARCAPRAACPATRSLPRCARASATPTRRCCWRTTRSRRRARCVRAWGAASTR